MAYLVRRLALGTLSGEKTDDQLPQPAPYLRIELVHERLIVLRLPVGLRGSDLVVAKGRQHLHTSVLYQRIL